MEIIPELPNDTPVEQQSNFRDANNVTATPQAPGVTANDLVQPSESPLTIVSEMAAGGDCLQDHAVFARWQGIVVKASGDAAAGEFSGGDDRTPRLAAIPDSRRGQAPAHSR